MSNLTKTAEELLQKRYYQDGETWETFCQRIANHAKNPSRNWQDTMIAEYYQLIYNLKFIPSRMPYMGTAYPFSSSCFVLGIEDSLDSIMTTLKRAATLQKHGGGTGYNFSKLRPKGDLIKSTGGYASGPVSFMRLFHETMTVVLRAGKKHAAQMAVLNVDHPDIREFIHAKDEEGKLWTFNISVGITDAFMNAVRNNENWELRYDGIVYDVVNAKELFTELCQLAWTKGDPGIIFMDTVNNNNKYPEPIYSSNPCGEQMLPNECSCNLGSINLVKFLVYDRPDGIPYFDFFEFKRAVMYAIAFLDDSLKNAWWPIDDIAQKTKNYRNLGLGVMGFADVLYALGIPYNSEAGYNFAAEIGTILQKSAEEGSALFNDGANTTLTSIAPTGSISMLANCSSGIEPVFGLVQRKNTYIGSFYSVNPIFESYLDVNFPEQKDLILEEVATKGTVQHIKFIPEHWRKVFVVASDIEPEAHVNMQSVFQNYIDNAISKTINLRNEATVEDIQAVYWHAWTTGCKSVTVYRDGSRNVQVLEATTNKSIYDNCPECGMNSLKDSEGCQLCYQCGYSACSL